MGFECILSLTNVSIRTMFIKVLWKPFLNVLYAINGVTLNVQNCLKNVWIFKQRRWILVLHILYQVVSFSHGYWWGICSIRCWLRQFLWVFRTVIQMQTLKVIVNYIVSIIDVILIKNLDPNNNFLAELDNTCGKLCIWRIYCKNKM